MESHAPRHGAPALAAPFEADDAATPGAIMRLTSRLHGHSVIRRCSRTSHSMCPMSSASLTQDPRPSVVIVGAGFAGLSAARELHRSGAVQVVVLEAGQRVGGRAWTHRQKDDLALELGATWIHGLGTQENLNPIWTLALEQGLMKNDPELYATEWWESEWLLPGRPTPLIKEEYIVVQKVVKAFSEAVEALEPSMEGSVAQQLQGPKEKALAGVAQQHLDLAQRAWRWRELLQRAIDGSPSGEQIGAAFLAGYEDFEGPFAAIPCGYQGLAEALAAGIDVRLGQEVQHIEYGPGGVRVRCRGGAAYEGAAAIVTVSLGVLKAQHKALFSPPLPPRTVQAIERIQIGVVDKLFVNLAPSASAAAAAAPDGSAAAAAGAAAGAQEGGTAAAGPAREWVSLGKESAGDVVSYALLWAPEWQGTTAAQQQPAELQPLPAWVHGLYSLRFGGPEFKWLAQAQPAAGGGEAPATGQRPGQGQQPEEEWAVMWVSGEDALALERSSDEEVLAAVRGLLRAFPAAQRLPRSWDIGPGATGGALVRSRWGINPQFQGSYSFLGPHAGPEDVEALSAPLWAPAPAQQSAAAGREEGEASSSAGPGADAGSSGGQQAPVLLFAGEAQHVAYMGCAHAALLSGQRQARQLLQHHLPI